MFGTYNPKTGTRVWVVSRGFAGENPRHRNPARERPGVDEQPAAGDPIVLRVGDGIAGHADAVGEISLLKAGVLAGDPQPVVNLDLRARALFVCAGHADFLLVGVSPDTFMYPILCTVMHSASLGVNNFHCSNSQNLLLFGACTILSGYVDSPICQSRPRRPRKNPASQSARSSLPSPAVTCPPRSSPD